MTKTLGFKDPCSRASLAACIALLGATQCGGNAQQAAGSAGSAGDSAATADGTSGGSTGAATAGSSAVAGSNETLGSAGSPGTCGAALSAAVRRAPVCDSTSFDSPGSGLACTADADCTISEGNPNCLHGHCGPDQCYSDSDCPVGQACRCSDEFADTGNTCQYSGCQVDADCGPAGICSPDNSRPCGRLQNYQCHSAADTCNSDADCCNDAPRCGYHPELGHWACAALDACSG